jgi:16S rRNA G966 N2-methylase RsmD
MLPKSLEIKQISSKLDSYYSKIQKVMICDALDYSILTLGNHINNGNFDKLIATRYVNHLSNFVIRPVEEFRKMENLRELTSTPDTYLVIVNDDKSCKILKKNLWGDEVKKQKIHVHKSENCFELVKEKPFANRIIFYDLPNNIETLYLCLKCGLDDGKAIIFYDHNENYSLHINDLAHFMNVSKYSVDSWFGEEKERKKSQLTNKNFGNNKRNYVAPMVNNDMRRLGWTQELLGNIKLPSTNLYSDISGTKYITRYDVGKEQLLEFYKIAKSYNLSCLNENGNIIKVVDCVCSIGGNVLAFALQQEVLEVHAIEIDPTRFKALEKNVQLFKPQIEKIQQKDISNYFILKNMNFLNYISQQDYKFMKESIFYLDPPWGGYAYKKHGSINELYLDTEADAADSNANRSISTLSIIKQLLEAGACLIGLKLPLNFNVLLYEEKIVSWYPKDTIKIINTNKFPGQYFFIIAKLETPTSPSEKEPKKNMIEYEKFEE